MNNLLAAIMTKLSGSSFSADVGGRIFLDRAPANTEFPYCVFAIISDVPQNTFKDNIEDVSIQFSLFSSSQGATEITTMYADLKTLLDDAILTISSNTNIWTQRESLVTMDEDITTDAGTVGVRHWAVTYSILNQKN